MRKHKILKSSTQYEVEQIEMEKQREEDLQNSLWTYSINQLEQELATPELPGGEHEIIQIVRQSMRNVIKTKQLMGLDADKKHTIAELNELGLTRHAMVDHDKLEEYWKWLENGKK